MWVIIVIMFELDEKKIEEYKSQLEKEDTLLPLVLMIYINPYKYINNLQKNNNAYMDVIGEMFNRRDLIRKYDTISLLSYEEKELKKWLEKHKEYEDILL